MPQKLFLIAFLALCGPLTESHGLRQGGMRRYLEASQKINHGNLNHGENCSWEAEQARQNLTSAFFSGSRESYLQNVNYFARSEVETCSAAKLLVCDRRSLNCTCGNPDQEALQGVNRSLFVFEDDDGTCRRNTNTTCISTDMMLLFGFRISSSTCKTGTTCKTGNGRACSTTLVIGYLVTKFGYSVLSNPERLLKELMFGKVCSCRT